VLTLAVLLLGGAAAPPAPAPAEALRLAAGEVLVALERSGRSALAEGVARGVIDAPPERVFAAVADFAHYAEFMPFVRESSARPLPDGSALVFERLDLPAPLGERHFRVRAHAARAPQGARWAASWAAVPGSGNLVAQRGSWTLVEFAPGRTLATCRLYTDLGNGFSAWLANRATARSLPWIFDGLRQQVRRSRYDPR
jgi:uncharacterized protein YndB with AHSA1/START domain